MDEEHVVLRTYGSVWNIERKIYHIEGLKLLVPLATNEVIYIIVSLIVSIFLIKVVPFYNRLNWIIKFVIVPYGLMKFLTKQKLDGKYPHKFFVDYMIYRLGPKKIDRFQSFSSKRVKFYGDIICQEYDVINKTDEIMTKKGGKKKIWNRFCFR